MRSAPGTLTLLCVSVTLCVAFAACSAEPQPQARANRSDQQQVADTAPATTALPNFVPLVERYGPAVVNVEVVQQVPTGAAQGQMQPSDPLSEFFRRFGIPAPEFNTPRNMPMRGAGSGFIVTPDGYILTNAHVVANAEQVTVRLTDRREFTAEVIGADARTDVAVIKIEAEELPVVKLGDPEELQPGEWVVAIGSPFGLDNSATAGIVSATSRAVAGDIQVPFIQTDVAVNPGNSGGPLFNLQGEVVGINSMIFSRTGGYMGLSFAIPIDVAVNVRDQLIKTGRVVRGRIGVTVQEMSAQLADSFGLERPQGALVSSVESGGPADEAGLQPGDVILELNGEPIDRYVDLSREIAALKPGSEAELQVWRGGKEREIDVRIGELKEEGAQVARAGQRQETEAAKLGLAVRPLTPQEKQQVETEGELVVEQVSGPAALAGVQPGDIVLGVNGNSVESVKELRNAAEDLQQGDSVALLVQRGNAQIFVPLRVG